MKAAIIWLYIMAFTFPSLLSAKVTISDEATIARPLGQDMVYLIDQERALSDKDVISGRQDNQFQKYLKGSIPSFGFAKTYPHWVKFEIYNETFETRELLIESSYSATDYIYLWQVDRNRVIEKWLAGDHVPFSKWQVNYRNPTFEVALKPGINTFYSKIHTTSGVQFPFKLWDYKSFEAHRLDEYLIVGFLFGSVAVVGLYNFFLSVSLWSKTYGLYVLYNLSFLIFAVSFYGFLPMFFPNSSKIFLTEFDLYAVIDMITVTAVAFSIDFLGIRERSRAFYRLLSFLFWIAFINAFVNVATDGFGGNSVHLTVAHSFFTSIFLIPAGIYCVI